MTIEYRNPDICEYVYIRVYVFAFHFERYPAIRSVLAADIVRFRPQACRSLSPCLPAFLFIYVPFLFLFFWFFPGAEREFRFVFMVGKFTVDGCLFVFSFFCWKVFWCFGTVSSFFAFSFRNAELGFWFILCFFYGVLEFVWLILVQNLLFQLNKFTIIV